MEKEEFIDKCYQMLVGEIPCDKVKTHNFEFVSYYISLPVEMIKNDVDTVKEHLNFLLEGSLSGDGEYKISGDTPFSDIRILVRDRDYGDERAIVFCLDRKFKKEA